MTARITGRLLDAGHLPVISLLAAAGLAAAVAGWRRAGPERALVAMLCACLLLSFGRTTFDGLISVVPGHADIFFRRFLMGGQLAAIYLAGLGGEEVTARTRRLAASAVAYLSARRLSCLSLAPTTAVVAVAVVYLVPAWRYCDAYDAANAAGISAQRLAQRQGAPQLAALAAILRRGGGRVYAGSPSNWGQYFTTGGVPMYQYLASLDLDEVGYTLRTASLIRSAATQMIAPAPVGVTVPAGVHHLAFRYTGSVGYPELLALAVLALAVTAWLSLNACRQRQLRVARPGNRLRPRGPTGCSTTRPPGHQRRVAPGPPTPSPETG